MSFEIQSQIRTKAHTLNFALTSQFTGVWCEFKAPCGTFTGVDGAEPIVCLFCWIKSQQKEGDWWKGPFVLCHQVLQKEFWDYFFFLDISQLLERYEIQLDRIQYGIHFNTGCNKQSLTLDATSQIPTLWAFK